MTKEWSGGCHPTDPDNYWEDDDTQEAVCAWCAHRATSPEGVKHSHICDNPHKGHSQN